MCKPKISLFFGAGAECSYGLPSGGKFALDIFKMDPTEDKKLFRSKRDIINRRSTYAKYWLPENYWSKPISSFGKSHYEDLVRGSLENKRIRILEYINNFDNSISNIVNEYQELGIDLTDLFEQVIGMPIGQEVFTHVIRLSELLNDERQSFRHNMDYWYSALSDQRSLDLANDSEG